LYHLLSRYFWTDFEARNDWEGASLATCNESRFSNETAGLFIISSANSSSLRKHSSIISDDRLSKYLNKIRNLVVF